VLVTADAEPVVSSSDDGDRRDHEQRDVPLVTCGPIGLGA
jgi:hypothetical protein